jgi:hypothetical protein
METRVCTKCGIEKPLSEFYLVSKGKGYRGDCKECNLKRKKLSHQLNPNKKRESQRKYRIENPNKFKEWYNSNIEHNLIKIKNWKKENPDKHKEYKKRNKKKRLLIDSKYRLKNNIASLIRDTFKKKGYKKNTQTFNILGIDYDGFMKHIEAQFTNGMNWENIREWEIDHIIPISIARNEEDIIKLNHHSNLRPLWVKENREKSDKILEEYKGLLYKLLGDDFVIE